MLLRTKECREPRGEWSKGDDAVAPLKGGNWGGIVSLQVDVTGITPIFPFCSWNCGGCFLLPLLALLKLTQTLSGEEIGLQLDLAHFGSWMAHG